MAYRLESSYLNVISWLAFISVLCLNCKFNANVKCRSGEWKGAPPNILACSNQSAPTICSPPLQPPLLTFPPHYSILQSILEFAQLLSCAMVSHFCPLACPSCLGHTSSSHFFAKLTPIHISSFSLHISSLQKLSMNSYNMSGPLVKAFQTSLYFPFNDAE